MQKWEYLFIHRSRGLAAGKKGESFLRAADWENWVWSSSMGEVWEGDKFIDLLNRLGDQSWELVSPRSDAAGGESIIAGAMSSFGGTGVGQTMGSARDYAGFTSGEEWVFKHPKS